MKILIVDDEALVRIGMRTIIPWEQNGFYVVGEAVNGIDALRLARIHHPDIVLVDIVMPEMDGLDFIREIRNEMPLCKFIILSCKNDVEYYKEAITLGVSEYVQKGSVSPEEILSVVNRVSEEIRKQRVFYEIDSREVAYINHNVVLTEFLNHVLKGHIKDPAQIRKKLECHDIHLTTSVFYVIVFSIDTCSSCNYDSSLEYSIINICQQIINDMGNGYVFKNYNDIVTAIVSCPNTGIETDSIMSLFCRIKDTANQYFDVDVTAGVSKRLQNPEEIGNGYCQAVASLSRMFFNGKGRSYFSNCPASDQEILVKVEKEKEIILNISSPFETPAIIKSINTITHLLSSSGGITPLRARGIYLEVLYHIISLLYKEEISIRDIYNEDFDPVVYIQNLESIQEIEKSMEDMLQKILTLYQVNFSTGHRVFISLIKQYIEEHINEKISLDQISKAVHLSPTYISRLFKRETGENLQYYILRRKVEKSKELLKYGHKLYEVSEAMAFSSESYFIKIFKSYTDLTPRQYIKQISQHTS